VYISKISLKNIRGFESLEFDLDRGGGHYAGWTVFTGGNGSGKSTLLKAVAFCLVPPDARFSLQPDASFYPRKTPTGYQCGIDLHFVPCSEDDTEPDGSGADHHEGVSFSGNVFDNARVLGMASGGVFTRSDADQRPLKGWFSCGYGPFRRITNPNPNVEPLMKSKDSERFATLFVESATLSEVDAWLTKLRFEELEKSESAARQLALFLDLVGDGFLPAGYIVDRVDSKGLWLRDLRGVQLSWFEMADGHRTAVILLADIVRHMIRTYGIEGISRRGEDGRIEIVRSGVVLIDEIDAHLHPSWQREIGFWLKRHFPNVQFLVTSHSPIILQAADPNGLFVLPEPGSGEKPRAISREDYQKIIASRPDTILLSPAFGLENTRSEVVVQKRAQFSKLQIKKRSGAKLSTAEETQLQGLLPFVRVDEED
jgi:energy-coupling factor transporter ATP-binding protein EcfA2